MQNLILKWTTLFVKLFEKYSPLELRLLNCTIGVIILFQQLRNTVQLTGSQQKPMNLYIRILLKNHIELVTNVERLIK